jgi:AAA domain/Protein of unknown function (DUF4011)
MSDIFNARIEAMRLSFYDNSLRNRLINLPANGSRQMLVLQGSARALRDALDAGRILEVGKDFETQIPLTLARDIIREILEEDALLQDRQGLSAIRLGLGVAAWNRSKSSRVLYAPLILRSVSLEVKHDRILMQGAPTRDEVNNYLFHNVGVSIEDLPVDLLNGQWAHTSGRFASFEDRAVLGLFPQTGQVMADRLDAKKYPHLLAHATLRRLALADDAQQLAATSPPVCRPPTDLPPNLHAANSDTYQNEVITLVRCGCPEVVVQGPPGTGKSQTIVNIIANGINDGRSVLFIAEKMSAINVVWDRLKRTDQYGAAFMLQGAGLDSASIASRLGVPNNSDIKAMLQSCSEQTRPRAILTSPQAFALYVPPDWRFDMVVVDEASQILVASAAAAIAASAQTIVCGDSQQMPPNNPASIAGNATTDGILSLSLLSTAERVGFTSRMLKRHYRSRHPSLIDVSNRLCYDTELQTVPSLLPAEKYGLHYHRVEGVYDRKTRTNLLEAKAIVETVRTQLEAKISRTLGVITMNEPQRELIMSLLDSDREIPAIPESTNLFIRAISDIQGEERDIILVSLTYGRTETGEFQQHLGPISAPYGEHRVNVLMTRARYRTSIFSGFEATTLPMTGQKGVEALRFHLNAAQTGHQTLAGKPCNGPLERALLNEKYTIRRFRRALLVGYYPRFRWDPVEYIGMIYLTGTVDALDEASEKKQLQSAHWKVTDFPYALMNEPDVRYRPEFKALLDNLKRIYSRFWERDISEADI